MKHEIDDIFAGLSSHVRDLMNGLMCVDTGTRFSLTDVCSHPFFCEAPSTTSSPDDRFGDLRKLHTQDPLKLPRRGGGDDACHVEDKAWARRQCSMVWSPMPPTYDFQSGGGNVDTKRTKSVGPAHRLFITLEKVIIKEIVEESLCSWLP
jgi:hypothetical protein